MALYAVKYNNQSTNINDYIPNNFYQMVFISFNLKLRGFFLICFIYFYLNINNAFKQVLFMNKLCSIESLKRNIVLSVAITSYEYI